MKYPEVRYVRTEQPAYLELHCYDGTYRGVIFETDAAAAVALRPGRAELDCGAVLKGFLPLGARLVSRPGVVLAAFHGDDMALKAAEARAADAPYVTAESDEAARLADVAGSSRYDLLAGFGPQPSPSRATH
ncbi:hypothetical protein [Sphingomonas sp. RIT328]|uniref:hypothetical protein n=1 Tax=Sphingomonas sp. RIT328 TaxID=1470591 RepID=UPI0004493403|nr:hypothetical protein [Sphingomonas sp. RIT328]EZP49947.1 hypothetical protein BW41_03272 [Sphingomonas sp. RIT328]